MNTLLRPIIRTAAGYEFALALLAVSAGLAIRGAGSVSIDRVLAGRLAR